uniref:Carboxylic ester hydrolase n=1 Tax=Acrobeloides nanus TaxID=290746 RepID=A0A914EA12_9BILA
MVWIHGGGLNSGSNRLNLAGTVEALKFVKEEISNFGGDPTKITIAGESAGAASVSAHTYSPLSRDLFQQGIEESGTVYLCYEGALGSTNRNYLFASQMCGISSTDWNSGNFGSLKSCLMNLNISQGIVGESLGTSFFWTGYAAKEAEFHLFQNNSNVYVYEFSYYSEVDAFVRQIPGYTPVRHGAELPFIFMDDTTWLPIQEKGLLNASDIAVAEFFGASWTNFILPVFIGVWPPEEPDYNNGTYKHV